MNTNRLKVVPVYGWGWSEGDSTIDTPPPFYIEIKKSDQDNGKYRGLFGTVITQESRFANRSVVLIFRNFSTYDVLVYKDIGASEIPDSWYPENVTPLAIGFAEVAEGP